MRLSPRLVGLAFVCTGFMALAVGTVKAAVCANTICASAGWTTLATNCVPCEPPEGKKCCDMVKVPPGCQACISNGTTVYT